MSQLISPLDILTSSGSYPEREKSDECTSTVRANAADLAERCSNLLVHVGRSPRITSGFRTLKANAAAGGAAHSAHHTGEAADFEDPDGSLARAVEPLLVQFNLYMENPQHTKGWVHLTTRAPASGNRVFIP